MTMLSKGLLGAAVAAVAIVSTAAPSEAQYRYRDRDGISAGEVNAGAVILGGLAAVLSAGKNARYQDSYEDGYSNDGYNNSSSSRAAINQCVDRVENQNGGFSSSNVTQIRSIERTRSGYRIQGVLDGRDGSRYNDRYDQGERYGQNYRYDQNNGYDQRDPYDRSEYGNAYNRGSNGSQFTCYVERGRVVNIAYDGANRRY